MLSHRPIMVCDDLLIMRIHLSIMVINYFLIGTIDTVNFTLNLLLGFTLCFLDFSL